MNRLHALLLSLTALVATGTNAAAQAGHEGHNHPPGEHPAPITRNWAWPDSAVELASTLPVQEDGRVKPFSTFAGFSLLRINGKRSLKTPGGEKIDATEFLLDAVFFPEAAGSYECFLVDNPEVITAMGLVPKGPRARYSMDELEPGIGQLFQLAHEYSQVEGKDTVQLHVLKLASNLNLMSSLRDARVALFPPADPADEIWLSPAEVFGRYMSGVELDETQKDQLQAFMTTMRSHSDKAALVASLGSLHRLTVPLAKERGEYGKIGLEVSYYRQDLVFKSLLIFLGALLCTAFLWIWPRSRVLYTGSYALASLGTVAMITAITWRCIIRGKPPVSTLYDTLIFVSASGALIGLVAELMNRKRIALSGAVILATIGVFLAGKFEIEDGKDTMPTLVAVLDTNFWLATHVTCITLGYSAGMLTAFLGSMYLVCKILRVKRNDKAFYKTMSRMTYGVLCFGVFFSLIGTILGGIWANMSWGRFWGWDPKENGALLIVLSQVAILHGRMGGFLREHGTCAMAALGGIVIAFSWFGTNLLSVGLHSYGFTDGINGALWTYYLIQGSIVLLSTVPWLLDRRAAAAGMAEAKVSMPDAPAKRATKALDQPAFGK